jgi:hypothetical protein
MDIISAYREAGTYRGAAVISGTAPKTVKRVIARHQAGSGTPPRAPRERNYDIVTTLVAERVAGTSAAGGWRVHVCRVVLPAWTAITSSGVASGPRPALAAGR